MATPAEPEPSSLVRAARWRVPLGFACAAATFWLAAPTRASWQAGLLVAMAGEALRLWASGHIDKGREITRSGPYRFTRHPLYVGSAILGVGFAVAAWSVPVAVLAAVYLAATLTIAIRAEEATLDARFDGAYTAYREGRAAAVDRPFRWVRVVANREYRAAAGLALAFAFLYWKTSP